MKNLLFIGTAVLLIVMGAGAYYQSSMKSEESTPPVLPSVAMTHDEKMMDDGMKAESMMKKETVVAPKTETKKEMIDDGIKMTESTMEKDMMGDVMMKKPGQYIPYAEEKLSLASTGKVVLFFRASWCPPCRAVDADIKAHLNNIPSEVTILDVNYDDSAVLKQKHGVTYQHTFVQVDAQGNMIKKWSGSPTLAQLISEIK